MFRLKASVAAAAVLTLTLAGCAGPTESGEGNRGGDVTLVTIAAPGSLDPASASMGPLAPFYEAAYDTLLRLDADGEIQPWLATEWEYNDDRTQLTLSLRDDVTFADGSAFTAEVAAANLERFKAGTAQNASRLADVTSIEAVDETTLRITLGLPDPDLLINLSSDAGLIASGDALEDADLATTTSGSGAYILDSASTVIGSTYRYTANPDYWNPDVQHFDQLTIQVLPDVSAIVNAITTGEADVAQVPEEAIDPAEAAGWTVAEVQPGGFAGLMLFDRAGQTSEVLGNVKVRQAINYALDRPALINAMNGGLGTPTTQVFPPAGDAYDESLDDAYPYDPKKAKALLAEAGYPDGVTISLPDFGTRDNYVILEQMLKDSSISVQWVDGLFQNSITDMINGKFSSVFFSLGTPTDWGTINQILAPNASFNPFHSEDPQLDELIAQMQTGDDASQAKTARSINEYIVEQAWFAPVQSSFSMIASSPGVQITPWTQTVYPSIFDIQPK